MELFETPLRTKVLVALAAGALAVAGAITRDFGPAEQAKDAVAESPEIDIDELVPGEGVQIEPLDLDLN